MCWFDLKSCLMELVYLQLQEHLELQAAESSAGEEAGMQTCCCCCLQKH